MVTSMLVPDSGKDFADDLHVFHEFDRLLPDCRIMRKLHECGDEVQDRGIAIELNSIQEKSVLSLCGMGEDFKL